MKWTEMDPGDETDGVGVGVGIGVGAASVVIAILFANICWTRVCGGH